MTQHPIKSSEVVLRTLLIEHFHPIDNVYSLARLLKIVSSGCNEVSCWDEDIRLQLESVVCHGWYLPELCTAVFALFVSLF